MSRIFCFLICTLLLLADQQEESIQGHWRLYKTDQGFPNGYQELLLTDTGVYGIIEGIMRSPIEYYTVGENSLSFKDPVNPAGTETQVEFELKKDTLTLYFEHQEAIYLALKDSLNLQQFISDEITEEQFMKAYFARRTKFFNGLKEGNK